MMVTSGRYLSIWPLKPVTVNRLLFLLNPANLMSLQTLALDQFHGIYTSISDFLAFLYKRIDGSVSSL